MSALGALTGGLGGGSIGTAIVSLLLDTRKFGADLARAEAQTKAATASMQGSTSKASSVGVAAFGGLAGAAAIVGGAALKLAFDYDEAFTKIDAVTNASQEQVATWKEQVLGLAGETAQAPEELAHGLYFLASAGLDAAEIFPTLEAGAKAAAVGLGSVEDITRLTANVLNAFPAAGLKAADVVDTLVAAVREGTAQPDEFADAMGRILPVASKAGISFDQLAASLATVSNIGLDVNEGVTAMRGLIQALVAPTNQTKETLGELGLTTDQVRRSLSEDGLIATLRLLEKATGGNIEKMKGLVPNVRALTGAFGLTGQEAKKVDDIFRNVANSSGALGEAFKTTSESEGFQLKKTLNELVIELTKLGEVALPVVVDALKLLGVIVVPIIDDIRLLSEGIKDLFQGDLPGSQARAEGFNYMLRQMKDAFRDGRQTADELAERIAKLGEDMNLTAEENRRLNEFLASIGWQEATDGAIGFAVGLGHVGPKAGEAAEGITGIGNAARGAAPKIHRFGGVTREELDKINTKIKETFAESVSQFDGFKRKWEGTARSFRNQVAGMAAKSREMAQDLRDLRAVDGVPKGFKDWLLQQGPDAVHNFVRNNKEGKDAIVEDWRTINQNVRNSGTTIDKINTKLQTTKTKLGNLDGTSVVVDFTARYHQIGEPPPGFPGPEIEKLISAGLVPGQTLD